MQKERGRQLERAPLTSLPVPSSTVRFGRQRQRQAETAYLQIVITESSNRMDGDAERNGERQAVSLIFCFFPFLFLMKHTDNLRIDFIIESVKVIRMARQNMKMNVRNRLTRTGTVLCRETEEERNNRATEQIIAKTRQFNKKIKKEKKKNMRNENGKRREGIGKIPNDAQREKS